MRSRDHSVPFDDLLLSCLARELRLALSGGEISEVYDFRDGGIAVEILTGDRTWRYLGLTWEVPGVFLITSPLPRRARLAPQAFREALKGCILSDVRAASNQALLIFCQPDVLVLATMAMSRGVIAVAARGSTRWELRASAGDLPEDLEQRLAHWLSRASAPEEHFPCGPFAVILDEVQPGPPRPIRVICGPADLPSSSAQVFDSASEAVEYFVTRTLRWRAFERQKSDLVRAIRRKLKKLRKLQRNLQADLEEAERAEEYRTFGNLILANVGANPRGETELAVRSFDAETVVRIPLEPAKSRVENAQEYFRKARKLDRKRQVASERLAQTAREIKRADELLSRAERAASFKELQELRTMVKDSGEKPLAKAASPSRTEQARDPAARLLRFRSVDGLDILAGRSAEENDFLTFRVAKEHDFWFHVAGGPGAHVVVRNPRRLPECPPRTAEQAAALAAYLSKFRNSSSVLVHMTQKRYLKRAKGGRPGEVLLKTFTSLFARPALPDE